MFLNCIIIIIIIILFLDLSKFQYKTIKNETR